MKINQLKLTFLRSYWKLHPITVETTLLIIISKKSNKKNYHKNLPSMNHSIQIIKQPHDYHNPTSAAVSSKLSMNPINLSNLFSLDNSIRVSMHQLTVLSSIQLGLISNKSVSFLCSQVPYNNPNDYLRSLFS